LIRGLASLDVVADEEDVVVTLFEGVRRVDVPFIVAGPLPSLGSVRWFVIVVCCESMENAVKTSSVASLFRSAADGDKGGTSFCFSPVEAEADGSVRETADDVEAPTTKEDDDPPPGDLGPGESDGVTGGSRRMVGGDPMVGDFGRDDGTTTATGGEVVGVVVAVGVVDDVNR